MAGFAILVIWADGEQEYLKQGVAHVVRFSSRKRAQEQREFMLMGMDEDVQSVNVVPFPRGCRGKDQS